MLSKLDAFAILLYIYRLYIYMYIPRTQIIHILEDLTHKMEGQPPKKEVKWVLGIYVVLKIEVFYTLPKSWLVFIT